MRRYDIRGSVRYTKLVCADCPPNADRYHVINVDGEAFYEESQPGVPYLCPTHRLVRYPDARLYAAVNGSHGGGAL